jgi:methionine salvage enolase-phosphatase E1
MIKAVLTGIEGKTNCPISFVKNLLLIRARHHCDALGKRSAI